MSFRRAVHVDLTVADMVTALLSASQAGERHDFIAGLDCRQTEGHPTEAPPVHIYLEDTREPEHGQRTIKHPPQPHPGTLTVEPRTQRWNLRSVARARTRDHELYDAAYGPPPPRVFRPVPGEWDDPTWVAVEFNEATWAELIENDEHEERWNARREREHASGMHSGRRPSDTTLDAICDALAGGPATAAAVRDATGLTPVRITLGLNWLAALGDVCADMNLETGRLLYRLATDPAPDGTTPMQREPIKWRRGTSRKTPARNGPFNGWLTAEREERWSARDARADAVTPASDRGPHNTVLDVVFDALADGPATADTVQDATGIPRSSVVRALRWLDRIGDLRSELDPETFQRFYRIANTDD